VPGGIPAHDAGKRSGWGLTVEVALLTADTSPLRVTGPARGEDWRSAAACNDTDPDLFFPLSGSGKSLEQAERAKAVCAGCPVRRSCLAFAQRTGQVHGIWGGLTEEERLRDRDRSS
jgi:WhiB family transcriptional regulator, redox-sensing transcriptional regulator